MSKWIIVNVDTQLRLGQSRMIVAVQLLKLGDQNQINRVVEYDAEKLYAETNRRVAELLTRDPDMAKERAYTIAMDEEAEMLGNLPIERCVSNELVLE